MFVFNVHSIVSFHCVITRMPASVLTVDFVRSVQTIPYAIALPHAVNTDTIVTKKESFK